MLAQTKKDYGMGDASQGRMTTHQQKMLAGDDLIEQRVFQQAAEQAHEGHRRAHFLAVGVQREAGVALQGRHRQRRRIAAPSRHVAAQRGAAFAQVAHLG